MREQASRSNIAIARWRTGRPPAPNEHGAWFMLFVPLLLPLLAGPATPLAPALLLIVGVVGAFMGQHVIRLMIRRRRVLCQYSEDRAEFVG